MRVSFIQTSTRWEEVDGGDSSCHVSSKSLVILAGGGSLGAGVRPGLILMWQLCNRKIACLRVSFVLVQRKSGERLSAFCTAYTSTTILNGCYPNAFNSTSHNVGGQCK